MKEFLRDARESDMDMLFQWVNDKEVRKSSFQTKDITYEEHQKWFMDMLHREDVRQYIYVLNEEPVGQIRILLTGEEAEISYSIAPKYRCMGYGKRMISALKSAVQEEYPGIRRLVAQVKPENVASQKAFLDCGYYEKCRVFVLDFEMAVKDKFISNNSSSIKKWGGVLFLTNNSNTLELFEWITATGIPVQICSENITKDQVAMFDPKLIVSYNYSHIIKKDVIDFMKGRIINLHISFLPWNRGTSPNLWSFLDETPKGVTIHQVDEGLDTGAILYQKECFFDTKKETFTSVYMKLHIEIVQLFQKHWKEIYTETYTLKLQSGVGSCHTRKDLEILRDKISFNWEDNIDGVVQAYRKIQAL